MEIEVFTLCDAAADYQGRLSILGIFDTVFANNLPSIHPACTIAVRLRFDAAEAGYHRLALHIVDTDGSAIIPALQGEFNVQINNPNDLQAAANLVLNLQGVQFSKYGEHAVKLLIDNRVERTIPFWVKHP